MYSRDVQKEDFTLKSINEDIYNTRIIRSSIWNYCQICTTTLCNATKFRHVHWAQNTTTVKTKDNSISFSKFPNNQIKKNN